MCRLFIYLSTLYVCMSAGLCFPICVLKVFRVTLPGVHARQSTSLLKYAKLLFAILEILVIWCSQKHSQYFLFQFLFDEISHGSASAKSLLPL